jgi:hypothetical protein
MEALRATLQKNPHKNLSFKPITFQFEAEIDETQTTDGIGPGGLHPVFLDPPGPVSLYMWITDPMFRGATANVRRVMLRDKIMEITLLVEQECRGAKWRRPKILEQLAAQQTAAVSPPQDTWELDRALAHIYQYQKVLVDEANRKIVFTPDNPTLWSADRPVWIVGIGSRVVFHKGQEHDCRQHVLAWLEGREDAGWHVSWPEAEGTLEAIKSAAAAAGAKPKCEKPKKQDYAVVLGRLECIKHLAGFAATTAGA